ncbi:hypothetical protein HG536_0F01590 [Torulaspora globosa]|uniref:Zn(2)-C6 fungal-type domain-containing protein n=1 Tax=Torulaspora globosa TaxID=48254 RepID=A0A7G3ZJZ8_9SACH|nr:uncharacterized protein HG536_0F01590 [Torulaspora globosa]QLL33834.1 hypothetical protein HG536_0F01590 [Torulaspora globosa]
MTSYERESDSASVNHKGVTCSENGRIEEGGERSGAVTKRKYGNPEAPPETKMLLVTKNKKIRHSQACDRCRLKKVKCDGLKPQCSQCKKANFRCTTSDRLTRRGFPKGYTEMLEMEVVRLQKALDELGGGSNEDDGVTLEEPKKEPKIPKKPSKTKFAENEEAEKVIAEPQFPFINDTFHYYDNYVQGQNYLGHRTWDLLQKNFAVSDSVHHSRDINEEEITKNTHMFIMTNLLQLQPNSFWLPRFLTTRYDDNLHRLKQAVVSRVQSFNKYQNSLVPLLYPFEEWQCSFDQLLNHDSRPDPTSILALLFIVQINWVCLDDALLFKVTKMICSSTASSLKSLQTLLLACFYFMGDQSSKEDRVNVFASELLHMAYGIVLDLGLYINSNKLIPVTKKEAIQDHDSRIVTFWTFQFLDSWWSLIQGLPKSNFMVDEFHPRSISSLNIPTLKPLSLLLNFTANSLDGCNLLHTLSTSSGKGKSKLIYLAESFRQLLVQWKLYHQLQDHEDEFNSEELYRPVTLTKPDVIEIQLTLFYLVVSLLSDRKPDSCDFPSEAPSVTSNLEDIAYEILSLYYLLLVDQSGSESESLPPMQFNLQHILPCPNRDLINSCLWILHEWAMAPQGDNELEGQLNWKYDKYRKFLLQWCHLYFIEDPEDPILAHLSLSFKIRLKEVAPNSKKCKEEYLQKVDQFINKTSSFVGRSNLLRSNSHAVMDQFDMFSQIDLPSNMLHDLNAVPMHGQNLEKGSPPAQLTHNDNNNIIDMSNFRSQILIEHEETDDGYAEDDDEDDEEDDLKPLEIPFSSKRAGSLFHTKHNLPPSHRAPPSAGNSHRRRTVDHIILENSNFGSQTQLPAMKKQNRDSLNEATVQPNLHSPDLIGTYQNYSVKLPARKAMSTNSGGRNLSTRLHENVLPPPPLPHHETLFDPTIRIDSTQGTNTGSTHSSHTPQIVETPRAFVDMLLLQPSEARAVIKSTPPCSTTIER